jgi:hypothetical protein
MLLKVSLGFGLLAFVPGNAAPGQGQIAPEGTLARCEATQPNGRVSNVFNREYYGKGAVSVYIYPAGTVVFKPGGGGFVEHDGSLGIKWPWWRGVKGQLKITGRRLDAPAPTLRAWIPDGYGDTGWQVSNLIFPQPGCWEVTGTVGRASLTFVTRVVKIGDGPAASGR